MKIINQPIKIAAVFCPPNGFVYAGRRYKVVLVQDNWESRSWEHGNIQHFRLQVMGLDRHEQICEVAFVQDEMRWILEKL